LGKLDGPERSSNSVVEDVCTVSVLRPKTAGRLITVIADPFTADTVAVNCDVRKVTCEVEVETGGPGVMAPGSI